MEMAKLFDVVSVEFGNSVVIPNDRRRNFLQRFPNIKFVRAKIVEIKFVSGGEVFRENFFERVEHIPCVFQREPDDEQAAEALALLEKNFPPAQKTLGVFGLVPEATEQKVARALADKLGFERRRRERKACIVENISVVALNFVKEKINHANQRVSEIFCEETNIFQVFIVALSFDEFSAGVGLYEGKKIPRDAVKAFVLVAEGIFLNVTLVEQELSESSDKSFKHSVRTKNGPRKNADIRNVTQNRFNLIEVPEVFEVALELNDGKFFFAFDFFNVKFRLPFGEIVVCQQRVMVVENFDKVFRLVRRLVGNFRLGLGRFFLVSFVGTRQSQFAAKKTAPDEFVAKKFAELSGGRKFFDGVGFIRRVEKFCVGFESGLRFLVLLFLRE